MVDRTIPPNFVEPQKFKLPQPEVIQFTNGSRFFILNVGEQPVIKIEFIFKAGSWFEAISGLAFFTGRMLSEGTSSFSSRVIAENLDKVGAFIEIDSGFDYINLSIHVPTRHFDEIENTISQLLFCPEFPESELEIQKKIHLQQLKINEQKNSFVAARLFRSKLYEGGPYGGLMTQETIRKITNEDLKKHYDTFIHGKFDIFLSGKFKDSLPKRICNLLDHKMKSEHQFEAITNAPQAIFNKYVERKESVQSSIILGKRSINKQHKKFPELLLLNEVFGGYFGSRLMQNIREDKGYTYSIYSHLATMKEDAYFVIKSDVKKEKKDHVIEEINCEIEKLKKELISEEELFQVKNFLKGSLLNSLTTPFSLTEKLKNIYLYDLGIDFYDRLFDQIDSTDQAELMTLANNLLFDQPLSSVVVG